MCWTMVSRLGDDLEASEKKRILYAREKSQKTLPQLGVVEWLTLVISTLERLRQEDGQELEESLGYINFQDSLA